MEKELSYVEKLELRKKEWGDGPWTKEHNRVDFDHVGLPCFVQRNNLGVWCGYVGVPKGHPAFEKAYDDVNVSVHGGLTYANLCQGHICHEAPEGEDHVWWLGFDCGHLGDLVPAMRSFKQKYFDIPGEALKTAEAKFPDLFRESYRDEAYVIAETKHLAEQLAEQK